MQIDMLCVAEFATDTEMPMSAIYTYTVLVTSLDTYFNRQILHNQDVLRLNVFVYYVPSMEDRKAMGDRLAYPPYLGLLHY